jgi:ABC-2 type transport system permease protein
MRAALLIAFKDIKQRLRDFSAIMMAIILPLTLAFIFSVIFGGASTPRAFRYAVVVQDEGELAQVFVDDILRDIEDQGIIELQRQDATSDIRTLIRNDEIDAGFVVPAGFTAAAQGSDASEIQIIGNIDQPTATDVARSIAMSFVSDLNSTRLAIVTVLHSGGIPTAQAPEVTQRAVQAPRPLVLEDVSTAERQLDFKTFFAAGMAVFFLFFTVQFGVSTLLEERNEGTLSRLLAAPIPRWSILASKLLSSFAFGVVSMFVLISATTVLMGASWGNPVGVALLVVCGVLAATGVTAIVASLARTEEQAGTWQAAIAVLLGLLGGAFFPIAQAGGLFAKVSLITPHAWFLRGLADLAGGGGIRVTLSALLALTLFAVITGSIALLRLNRVVQP